MGRSRSRRMLKPTRDIRYPGPWSRRSGGQAVRPTPYWQAAATCVGKIRTAEANKGEFLDPQAVKVHDDVTLVMRGANSPSVVSQAEPTARTPQVRHFPGKGISRNTRPGEEPPSYGTRPVDRIELSRSCPDMFPCRGRSAPPSSARHVQADARGREGAQGTDHN
jgi:hypothetical protein